jgi:hypothetical protein
MGTRKLSDNNLGVAPIMHLPMVSRSPNAAAAAAAAATASLVPPSGGHHHHSASNGTPFPPASPSPSTGGLPPSFHYASSTSSATTTVSGSSTSSMMVGHHSTGSSGGLSIHPLLPVTGGTRDSGSSHSSHTRDSFNNNHNHHPHPPLGPSTHSLIAPHHQHTLSTTSVSSVDISLNFDVATPPESPNPGPLSIHPALIAAHAGSPPATVVATPGGGMPPGAGLLAPGSFLPMRKGSSSIRAPHNLPPLHSAPVTPLAASTLAPASLAALLGNTTPSTPIGGTGGSLVHHQHTTSTGGNTNNLHVTPSTTLSTNTSLTSPMGHHAPPHSPLPPSSSAPLSTTTALSSLSSTTVATPTASSAPDSTPSRLSGVNIHAPVTSTSAPSSPSPSPPALSSTTTSSSSSSSSGTNGVTTSLDALPTVPPAIVSQPSAASAAVRQPDAVEGEAVPEPKGEHKDPSLMTEAERKRAFEEDEAKRLRYRKSKGHRNSIVQYIDSVRRAHTQQLTYLKQRAMLSDPSLITSQRVIYLPRGGTYVQTSAGPLQFGLPPETIKDSMNLGLTLPTNFVLPKERFNLQMVVSLIYDGGANV